MQRVNKVSIPKLHSIRYKNRDNVEILEIMTRHDIDPNLVLMEAINAGMKEVVVSGECNDGTPYFASNIASEERVLWHLEAMKKRLLDHL